MTQEMDETTVLESKKVVKGEDEEGNKTINQYAVIQELGRGAYGKVKLVVHVETDAFYAIKILNKSILSKVRKGDSGKTAMDDVKKEIAVMKRLNHKNVVRLHEVINDPACNKVYLIMDYVQNGPVWSVGEKPLRLEKIRKYLVGMCHGLDYLHANNVLHRDIKPDNLLVDGYDEPKWCDFGVSSARDADGTGEDDLISDTDGTPAFLTPEQLNQQKIPGRMTDMWALGVTLYCMSFGRLPFEGRSIQELTVAMLEKEPNYTDCPHPDLKELLCGILHKDLDKRLGKDNGVQEILRHKFLEGMEGTDVVHKEDVNVTTADVEAAVQHGHNIKLRLAETVSAAMRIQHFKHRLRRKKRANGDTEPILSPDLNDMSPTSPCIPMMSPSTGAVENGGHIPPLAIDDYVIPPALQAGRAGREGSQDRNEKKGEEGGQDQNERKGEEGGEDKNEAPFVATEGAIEYLRAKGIPDLVDKAVRLLVEERPEDPADWLSQHFSTVPV
eukprot:Sspe_Gene.27367::Locus_11761_Transcript_1_1_Confidence_1.000_Length_1764::g.27367::m.27367/K07359/CAMKK2; calcium/calmodulin-dependent protein kinase kinase 2